MLISKFDLYKSEWLELVFDDRNKEYGAYDLRQRYAKNMIVAMGITFFTIALLCVATIIFKADPGKRMVQVVNDPAITVLPPPVAPIKHVDPPKPLKSEPPAQPIATIKDVPPVVVPDPLAEKPVINTQINGPISTVDTKGPAGPANVLPVDPKPGIGTQPADNKTVYDVGGVDVMPEPVGGDKAWAKFLNKNLRFPSAAQEDGVSGRVILSFIIEKDGTLSNIVVDRPAGHGFDEEALRVLKLAKAWKPGMQNGQAVRVRFEIPINFQLSSDNN
jgi:protein TonB